MGALITEVKGGEGDLGIRIPPYSNYHGSLRTRFELRPLDSVSAE